MRNPALSGITLFALMTTCFVGCGSDKSPPIVNDMPKPDVPGVVVPAEFEAVDTPNQLAESTEPDTAFVLDRLRKSVSPPQWSIAKSPLTWSTFTVDVGEEFSVNTTSQVWDQWTAFPTAITKKADSKVKEEIEATILAAKPGERPVERFFDFGGFRFEVTASNGKFADRSFVRISFIDAKYAN